MTANEKLSLALLIGRLITVYIAARVARKQWKALRAKAFPELRPVRVILFVGTIIFIIGNILPITIDVLGIFSRGSFGLLVAYVISNNITALLGIGITYYNIKLSERIELKLKSEHEEEDRQSVL